MLNKDLKKESPRGLSFFFEKCYNSDDYLFLYRLSEQFINVIN